MHAWVCAQLIGEDGLVFEEQPELSPGPGQVQVRTGCVALNFPDVLITRGKYQMKLEPPFIPGSELAGEVIAVGEGVTDIAPGQRVLAMTGFGAFAEEVLVTPPMQQIMVIPDAMSDEEAAAFNMVYGTAMHGLEQRGQLRQGETLLVLGAAGGCGSAAVQIGKAMGATVIAGASSLEKCELARRFGADEVINYREEDLRERTLELTGGDGVDVVFDPVGHDLFKPALRSLGWNGRYLVIGFAGGDIPQLGINYTILKSIAVVGVAYGMSAIHDPAMNAENFERLFDWYEQGLLKPHVGRQYQCRELPDALREMSAGNTLGKTVVSF
ncbi:MAG: NADPH:quinone oxidoreductase family protein [Halioglobus sp.]|nr:NADPH:quinone oxidoreductase family protein [Halioglobus sp.]